MELTRPRRIHQRLDAWDVLLSYTTRGGVEQAVRVEDAEYLSEGHTVPARLFRSVRRCADVPGVLLCPGRLREIDGLTFLAEAMAARGAVVLATAYGGMKMRPEQQDCLDGIRLSQRPRSTSTRLASPWSVTRAGAMAALRTAAKTDAVRSVVALQPVSDLSAYVPRHGGLRADPLSSPGPRHGDSPEAVAEAYVPLSAIHYADRIRVPVLLCAGTQDLHAPIDESMRMRDALLEAGNSDVHLEVLEGLGHFFEHMYAGYQHDAIVRPTLEWLGRTISLGRIPHATST